MTDEWLAILKLADRLVTLAENRWKTPEENPHADFFKRGEKPAPATTREEYEALPRDKEGRFSELVRTSNSKT